MGDPGTSLGWQLVEPPAVVADLADRRRARFIAAFSLLLCGATLGFAIPSTGVVRLVLLLMAGLSFAAWRLSRTRAVLLAGLVIVAATGVFPYFGMGSEAATTNAATEVMLLMLVPFIARLSLPLWPFLAMAMGNVVAVTGLLLSNPGIPVSAGLSVGGLVFLESMFIYVYGRIHDRNDEALAAAAAAAAHREQAEALAAANLALRETQAQLVRAGKLTTLGELAASVAHELNTPLMGISMCASFLRDDLPPGPGADMARRISESTEHCARIVEGLLHFGRQGVEPKVWVDLREAHRAALALCATRLEREGARVEVELPEPLWVVADVSALAQVVINLLVNAAQAMSEGGMVRVSGRASEGEVRYEVVDEGPGVDPAIADRVFEPFVSGRATQGALGLGLSISYGIAEDHGGRLEAENPPSGGARFRLALPAAPEPC